MLAVTRGGGRQWSLGQLCEELAQLHPEFGEASLKTDVDHAVRRLVAGGLAERVRPGVYRFPPRRPLDFKPSLK